MSFLVSMRLVAFRSNYQKISDQFQNIQSGYEIKSILSFKFNGNFVGFIFILNCLCCGRYFQRDGMVEKLLLKFYKKYFLLVAGKEFEGCERLL